MDEESALVHLLEPLYEAILEPDRLEEFNQRLAQLTGSHVTGVLVHDVQSGRGNISRMHGVDMDAAAMLREQDLTIDPWVSRAVPLLATGRVIDSEDLVPVRELQRTGLYSDYYRKLGITQQVVSVGLYDGANSVTMSMCQGDANRRYGERELALFRDMTPHWVNAYAILRRLEGLQQRVISLEAALEQTPVAMYMLAADLRLLRTNASGESLLSRSALHCSMGRLAAFGWQDATLQQMLMKAAQGHATTRAGDVEQLVLAGPDGAIDLVLTAHTLPAPHRHRDAAVLVFVQPLSTRNSGSLGRALQQLFGLTEAEKSLAMALQQHADLAAAAQACGIALSTAQTRLKIVYDKTGERSQPALLRLMSAIQAVSGE